MGGKRAKYKCCGVGKELNQGEESNVQANQADETKIITENF